MNFEVKFHEYLNIFAQNSRANLSQPMLEVYDMAVKDFGYERACVAMKALLMETKSWQMPTPAMIVAKIENKPSRYAEATEVAGRIVQAVDKFGYNRGEEAKAFIGEVGTIVVQRWGGWARLCEVLGLHISEDTARAQMRDSALAVMEISTHRSLDEAPQLESSKKLESAVKLLSDARRMP